MKAVKEERSTDKQLETEEGGDDEKDGEERGNIEKTVQVVVDGQVTLQTQKTMTM